MRLTILFLFLIGCISPSYHQRKVAELEVIIEEMDKQFPRLIGVDTYLCHCGQFHRKIK